MNNNNKRDWSSIVIWMVYFSLLAVLFPHTAWAFAQFEPNTVWGTGTSWAAAFAFEAAIAVMTHKLAKHIEEVPNYRNKIKRFTERYINPYSLGLVVAVFVSALANLAHAVEFGQEIGIALNRPKLFGLYVFMFGAALPFVSLLFARVLSDVSDTEQLSNPELAQANSTIKDLRSAVRDANKRADDAEQRFGAIGDLLVQVFADSKRERITAAHELWPNLPQRSIAIIADTSPGYVSETLSINGDDGEQG